MEFLLKIFIFSVLTVKISYAQNTHLPKQTITIEQRIDNDLKKALDLTLKQQYKKAYAISVSCVSLSDSIKNDSLLGKSYLRTGIVDSYLGKEKQAIENHRKAMAIFIRIKNYKYLGSAYNDIGVAYFQNSKNYDSAKIYFKKALDTYTYANNGVKMAIAAYNIGEVHEKMNELDQAEIMLKKSLSLSKKHNKNGKLDYAVCYAYQTFSEVLFKKKNIPKTIKYLKLAEKAALKNNYTDILVLTYKLKSNVLALQGKYEEAYNNMIKYNESLAFIHENEKSVLAQEMSAKFEVKENKALLEKAILENTAKEEKLAKSKQFNLLFTILFSILALAAFLLYKNNKLKIQNNKLLIQQNKELKELQLQTELNFLKTQIQPHFFFNTLNNLYALILEKSDKSADVILKLSGLMQYTIYGSKRVKVNLSNEINNIHNYLELESLRYGHKAFPNIEIEGIMDDIIVPPLIYITFLENCFKHGNVKDPDFKLHLLFKNLFNKQLLFKVTNTYDSEEINRRKKSQGIGIENIKRRLKLIYSNKYNLSIEAKKEVFEVNLTVPIL